MITKDTIIGDVLNENPETAQFFFEIGMHCLGCPASKGETIEQACAVHGADCEELLNKINFFLSKQNTIIIYDLEKFEVAFFAKKREINCKWIVGNL